MTGRKKDTTITKLSYQSRQLGAKWGDLHWELRYNSAMRSSPVRTFQINPATLPPKSMHNLHLGSWNPQFDPSPVCVLSRRITDPDSEIETVLLGEIRCGAP